MTERNNLVHVGITLGQTATSLLYLVVATQIFRRHRYSLEPRHILELNPLLACAVFAPLHIGSRYLADWPTVCGVVEWLRYYNWHDFITGLLLTQTDRFLALYWHAEYKGRVSPEVATRSVLVSKVVLVVPVCVAAGLSAATLQCEESNVLECSGLAKLELSLVVMDLPVLAAFTAVTAVSLYVGRVRRRLMRTIQPRVNLPSVNIVQGNLARNKFNDILVQDIESEEQLQTGTGAGTETTGGTGRNQPRDENRKPPETSPVPSPVFSQQVKDTLRLNLVTLTLVLMFLSRGLLNLYFYISQAECDDQTILLYRLNSFPQLILVVSYPLMIKKKLNK